MSRRESELFDTSLHDDGLTLLDGEAPVGIEKWRGQSRRNHKIALAVCLIFVCLVMIFTVVILRSKKKGLPHDPLQRAIGVLAQAIQSGTSPVPVVAHSSRSSPHAPTLPMFCLWIVQ
jgi:hypothetical protein